MSLSLFVIFSESGSDVSITIYSWMSDCLLYNKLITILVGNNTLTE